MPPRVCPPVTKRSREALENAIRRHDDEARACADRAEKALADGDQEYAELCWEVEQLELKWAGEDEDELFERFTQFEESW